MLTAGDFAPQFSLPDETGCTVTLAGFAGRRVLLYFYPKAFTPGCTTQACDLRDGYERFRAAGWEIVGISPDPITRLERFRREQHLPFPLLSDADHGVAEAYGAWGVKKLYGRESRGLIRSTFAVGPDSRLIAVWRNVRAAGHAARIAADLGLEEVATP
ncbi:MAG: thioredoxin-dependent thiol peroxidase [Acidimicrobiia bacterium]|nr:thioredoxin-dependent thiol peroxidase [Acidimicrobiia bacterium]